MLRYPILPMSAPTPPRSHTRHDFIVIGGGILGLATAWQLLRRYPDCSLLLLEKEPELAAHQTGRNSGVIHAGVYYTPGSLKARFCRAGNRATKAFCREHDIPFEVCGKLLVACNEAEQEGMAALKTRCGENRITVEELDAAELKQREPHINGVGALFVPSSGIVSYRAICLRLAALIRAAGGEIRLGAEVGAIEQHPAEVQVRTADGWHSGAYLVACAGLWSDRMVTLLGQEPDFRIAPFRGEYFQLPATRNRIVNHLIYPIPNPKLPFLGVHLTRMIDGSVTVGPNAVLALAREGYRKTDLSLQELWGQLCDPGLRRVLWRHRRAGWNELKNSLCKRGYLGLVHKYCPELELDELGPYPAGIRAQAISRNGQLVDDFLFVTTPRALVVANAPSPAATSALPISEHIVAQLEALIAQH